MNRLTEKKEHGEWSLKGVDWQQMYVGQTITQEVKEKLLAALFKLLLYENTGLSPREARLLKEENRWIPVSEGLPESTLPVLCRVRSTTISCTETFIIGSYCKRYWFFQNDTVGIHSFPLSEYKVLAWRPLPEPYEENGNE